MSSSSESEQKYNWNGKILSKKYIFIRKLGHGSYASVWLTYNINNKKMYAIKVHNSYDYDYGIKEYELYKSFNKLNIPHILNPVEQIDMMHDDNKHYCIVMELMGCSLYDLINIGALDLNKIKKILVQIFECLEKLHENNYVHADLKPENILIKGYTDEINEIQNKLVKLNNINEIKKYVETLRINDDYDTEESDEVSSHSSQGCISLLSSEEDDISNKHYHILLEEFLSDPVIYISDLGSCINTNDTSYYKKFCNTCYYTAPEILLKLNCNSKVDIWAIGCTLYELITGNVLFDPDEVKYMKNRYHLSKIIMYLGDIPGYMKDKSPMRDVYFKVNGLIKGVDSISITTLWNNINKNEVVTELLLNLLELDPKKRITAVEAKNIVINMV